jgi:tRNA threonylcarbamoyladenosine biosynthesis protein TsaB
VLGCDTSGRTASVALLEGGALTAELTVASPEPRSSRLLADIESLLARRGLSPADLDLLVASIGPGSFTGVRVGLASMKGLAYATGVPLVGVGTLDALAWPLLGRGLPVLAAFDARRSEVYAALFASDGAPLIEAAAWDPARLGRAVAEALPAGDLIGVGDGVEAYAGAMAGALRDRLRPAPSADGVVRASVVARLGLERRDRLVPLADLEPAYLRRPEAEEKRLRSEV